VVIWRNWPKPAEAIPDEDTCLTHLIRTRFGERLKCFRCLKEATYYRVKKRRSFECEHCGYNERNPTAIVAPSNVAATQDRGAYCPNISVAHAAQPAITPTTVAGTSNLMIVPIGSRVDRQMRVHCYSGMTRMRVHVPRGYMCKFRWRNRSFRSSPRLNPRTVIGLTNFVAFEPARSGTQPGRAAFGAGTSISGRSRRSAAAKPSSYRRVIPAGLSIRPS
jgi:hypothetical protein